VAPLRYEFPVDSLISRYKYQGHFCSGAVLADILLAELFKDQLSDSIRDQNKKPDLIVPVPLHWQRQFFRGFNQSQWLSQYLGQRLSIRVDAHLLKRCRNTPPQQGLKRTQRQKNLKGAFQVNRPVEGKHIALVDDVVTTGSTVSELSQLLKKAGATKVEIWCLARTPLEK
jgi:ComF family protein